MIYFCVNAIAIYSQDRKVRHQCPHLLLLLAFSMICLAPYVYSTFHLIMHAHLLMQPSVSYIILFTLKEEELLINIP